MVREIAYDEVSDAQQHFRSILDSMARPGKINRMDRVALAPPPGLNHATVLVAFALMDGDVAFHVVGMEERESEYLAANTRAAEAPVDAADFIVARGTEDPEILDSVDCGTLTYPDTAATIILQVDALSSQPLANALKVTFEGPGVNGQETLFVRGLGPDLLLALQARNAEFPLGLDAILTSSDDTAAPLVVCIPRTTRLRWEQC